MNSTLSQVAFVGGAGVVLAGVLGKMNLNTAILLGLGLVLVGYAVRGSGSAA